VLDDRKLAVLRAIVEDYVSTNEPVGSRALVERHNLDVSPATIRNDMAILEEQGYIVHPHTSAGRVPTDKGYRLFVDKLSAIKPFSTAERRAIETFLAGEYDLDDVVMRTVRLLAQLTRQVRSIPLAEKSPCGVSRCSGGDLTVVLITDTGRVKRAWLGPPVVTTFDPPARSAQRRLTDVSSPTSRPW
jgi:heat-inducible transcriptional repressor